MAENSFSHWAAANIPSAYKKNGLHQLLNPKNLWLGGEIVNGEIRSRCDRECSQTNINPNGVVSLLSQ